MNIISLNYDITDYAYNNEIEKIAEVIMPLSDDAKSETVPRSEEFSEMASKDFALVLTNASEQFPKFAMYTKPLVELNMAILAKTKNELPEEIVKIAATNLTCAANKYKIPVPDELVLYKSAKYMPREINISLISKEKFNEKLAACKTKPSKKEASKHALNGKYPIDSVENIKKASAWFDKNHNKLTVEEKLEFVGNIKPELESKEVLLDKTAALHQYLDISTDEFNPNFSKFVAVRKKYIPENEENLHTLYDDVIIKSAEIGVTKTAMLLEMVDKELGLDYHYSSTKIADPVKTTFGFIKKAGLDIDGTFVTLDSIRRIPTDDLGLAVGNDMIKELRGEEGVEILASLPKPIREEVMGLM